MKPFILEIFLLLIAVTSNFAYSYSFFRVCNETDMTIYVGTSGQNDSVFRYYYKGWYKVKKDSPCLELKSADHYEFVARSSDNRWRWESEVIPELVCVDPKNDSYGFGRQTADCGNYQRREAVDRDRILTRRRTTADGSTTYDYILNQDNASTKGPSPDPDDDDGGDDGSSNDYNSPSIREQLDEFREQVENCDYEYLEKILSVDLNHIDFARLYAMKECDPSLESRVREAEQALEQLDNSIKGLMGEIDSIAITAVNQLANLESPIVEPFDPHYREIGIDRLFRTSFPNDNTNYQALVDSYIVDFLSPSYSQIVKKDFFIALHAWASSFLQYGDQLLRDRPNFVVADKKNYLRSVASFEEFFRSVDVKELDEYGYDIDSPVPDDVKKIVKEEIVAKMPAEGIQLENVLKKIEGQNLSEKQQKALTAVKAIGYAIKAGFNTVADSSKKLASMILGATIALKDVATCLAKVGATGDYSDWYELVNKVDYCTGEALTTKDQIYSALGLLVGSGTFWRKLGGLVEGIFDISRKGVDKVFDAIGQTKDLLKNRLGIEDDNVTGLLLETGQNICNISNRTGMLYRILDGFQEFFTPSAYANDEVKCLVKQITNSVESARKLGIDNADDLKDLVSFTETPLIRGSSRNLNDRLELLNDVKGTVGPSAGVLRNSPGTASASQGLFDSQKLLRGTSGNAGLVPKEIGDRLANRQFNSFDDFRKAFWIEVGNSRYAADFSADNISKMREGKSPFTVSGQNHDGRKRYELHHIQPINQGGSVYDMSNLMIVTPRFHAEVLDRKYHYGR